MDAPNKCTSFTTYWESSTLQPPESAEQCHVLGRLFGEQFCFGERKRREHFKFFEKLGIPGPTPNIFFGNVLDMYRKSPTRAYREWIDKYGDTVGYFNGHRPVILTADLDLLRQIQIKDFQDFTDRGLLFQPKRPESPHNKSLLQLTSTRWKEVRSVLTPSFTTNKLRLMSPGVISAVEKLVSKIDRKAKTGEEFEAGEMYAALALDVICKSAMGIDYNLQEHPRHRFLVCCRRLFGCAFSVIAVLLAAFPGSAVLLQFINCRLLRFQNNGFHPFAEVQEKCKRIVAERQLDYSLEGALELNHTWNQEFKHAVLLDLLPLGLQLHLGVPSPGPRPNDALRQSGLNFVGAAYHLLPEVDHTVRDSSPPTPSRPARSAPAPAPVCRRPQATSSPLSSPTTTRGSGDITDPTPAPVPRAIGSVSNGIASPTTTPDPSTRFAEPGFEPARELGTMPISVPSTLPAIATVDAGHDFLRPPLLPTSGVLNKSPDAPAFLDPPLPGQPVAYLVAAQSMLSQTQLAAFLINYLFSIKNSLRRKDLLQLMIDAKDCRVDVGSVTSTQLTAAEDNDAELSTHPRGSGHLTVFSKVVLDDDDITQNAFAILVAGFETTSNTMSLVTHMLIHHPQVQENVRNELLSVLEDDEPITYSTIQKLPYLNCVILETMRLYPPAFAFVTREAVRDKQYEKFRIPAGTVVMTAVEYIHRDARHWERPDQFDPDRFLPENKSRINTMAMQAFGNGPRNCIGMRFAHMELRYTFAHILRKYRLEKTENSEKHPPSIEMNPIILKIKNGVKIKAVHL
ncbi:thromboxane-A synthase-like [Dermacentor silvarum]|uniref:thromboxane-A synthase-like n=1 Tax=Dermacentor silvarum TaxID=543639 RepID=UPI00189B0BAD|nr:thromboxane-A synthase-like [Dermacentor silvarum]